VIHDGPGGPGITKEFRCIAAKNSWTGWIRKDLPPELLGDFVRDPEAFLRAGACEVLKSVSKSTVVRRVVGEPNGPARTVIVKCFHPGFPLRRAASWFLPSRALKCLRAAILIESAGVGTAAPLAVLQGGGWKNRGVSYYVTEEIARSRSLRALLKDIQTDFSRKEARALKFRLLAGAAQLFYRSHAARIYHRDLKGGNILVRDWQSPEWGLLLVDLDGVSRMRRLWQSRRIKNLVQLCRIRRWDARDRLYFLKNYCDRFSLAKAERKILTRKVLALIDKRRLPTPARGSNVERS
jgi:serine/threonine protein kinase